MFKKKLTFVLCMVLTMSSMFSGCGKKKSEPLLPTDSVIESQAESVTSSTSSVDSVTSSPAQADGDAASVPELAPVEFERGYIDGFDYISPALNLRVSLDERFQFYDEEMLSGLNTSVANMSDNAVVGDAIDAGAVVIDMAAVAQADSLSVNTTYESSAPFIEAGMSSIQEFAENSVENVQQSISAMGASNIEISAVPVDIEGIDSYGMTVACDLNGMRFYEKIVMVENNGILGTVTVSGLSEESVDAVIQGIAGLG